MWEVLLAAIDSTFGLSKQKQMVLTYWGLHPQASIFQPQHCHSAIDINPVPVIISQNYSKVSLLIPAHQHDVPCGKLTE